MMMRSTSKSRISENIKHRDFFLMMVPSFQTDRLQCETVEMSDAKQTCSPKLNSVFSMVRWCRPPENDARSHSIACPVYTEIFIGRANRKWTDRFVDSSLVPKILFRIVREKWEGAGNASVRVIKVRDKRKKEGERKAEIKYENLASISELCRLSLSNNIVRNNFHYVHAIFHHRTISVNTNTHILHIFCFAVQKSRKISCDR